MKISEVIEKINAFSQPYKAHQNTRDVVLAGDPDQECTGIAVTCCATYEVIVKAKEAGINFIVTHESIFFGSRINKEDLETNDVYLSKKQFIEDNGICIWRDHDMMHGGGGVWKGVGTPRVRKDFIFWGIEKELGWEKYLVEDEMKPLIYQIPETSARELASYFIEKCHLNGLRIVGNLDARVSRVYFTQHVNGNDSDGDIIKKAKDCDVMIPLEICDYTLTQYVKDAAFMGKDKVIFEMGHFNCEEIGMKYMVQWLQAALVRSTIKVSYIQSGDTYQYYLG